ncbi:MAG TPA: hypothetical protein PKA82_10920 [Pyrinomonadaceae bacterium]|nr:hypothetical protein [Pyrinomonadaceae bacterium]
MKENLRDRSGERGSAGTKLLLALTVIGLVAHAGYNYVPVAYEAETMRSEMSTAVLQGLAMPGKVNPVDNVKERIQKAMVANAIPQNATLAVTQKGNLINARVAYVRDVSILPFGIYTYHYVFDHTATPTGILAKQAT